MPGSSPACPPPEAQSPPAACGPARCSLAQWTASAGRQHNEDGRRPAALPGTPGEMLLPPSRHPAPRGPQVRRLPLAALIQSCTACLPLSASPPAAPYEPLCGHRATGHRHPRAAALLQGKGLLPAHVGQREACLPAAIACLSHACGEPMREASASAHASSNDSPGNL